MGRDLGAAHLHFGPMRDTRRVDAPVAVVIVGLVVLALALALVLRALFAPPPTPRYDPCAAAASEGGHDTPGYYRAECAS